MLSRGNQNRVFGTVNSPAWTANHHKCLSDEAEKEADDDAPAVPQDPTKFEAHVAMISRRVANKTALSLPPLPPSPTPSAYGATPAAAPATSTLPKEKPIKCPQCNNWHKASPPCRLRAPAPVVPTAPAAAVPTAAPLAPARPPRSPPTCLRCGLEGHIAKECMTNDIELIDEQIIP